jgi:hypothetical protein
MTATERTVGQIMTWLPRLNGSLRFWGTWMGGKPFDNCYRAIACEGADDLLRIAFDAGETLNLWRPRGVTFEDEVFRIADADRAHVEWCYSTGPGPQFLHFARTGRGVTATANSERTLRPDRRQPAVELIAITASNMSRYQ